MKGTSFMSEFLIIIYQILKFFVIILIGVICVKCKIIGSKELDIISKLILKMTLPLLIFSNTVDGATRTDLASNLIILPVSIVVYVVWIIVSLILAKCNRLTKDRSKIYQAIFIFGNIGFIGIPLVSALYPKTGMIYISMYTIIDQVILWTYGIYLTSGQNQQIKLNVVKRMINPPLVATILALFVILVNLQLPSFLIDALKSMGGASSPLSLVYIGASLCFCNFREILKRKEIYVGICVKMLCLPIILYITLFYWLHISKQISVTMALLTALPCMITVPMLAKSNNVEGDYCISAVMLTHVFSLVLLPFVFYIISKI